MYEVTLETIQSGSLEKDVQTYTLGEMDSQEYDEVMAELADVLFELDVEFDDVEGDGDVMIDDILISVSEEEEFEKEFSGRKCTYIVKGYNK